MGFRKKSPPIPFHNNIHFQFHAHTSDDISGSIFSKKLVFLETST
ncbi:hypothetical protein NO004_510003 [Flavobacterium psychrophilum]|nr:hypothetical protein DK095_600073 [Flavobacterium psychrophilum]SNB22847.1 hypothetical protein JIP1600_640003 [Flavobacterium psychrophilum]SNB29039.1 hypothetical protein NO004_510003 [Flavobacterium psychrophilum]